MYKGSISGNLDGIELGTSDGVEEDSIDGVTEGNTLGLNEGSVLELVLGTADNVEDGVVLGEKQVQVPLQVSDTPSLPQRLEIFDETHAQSISNLFPS